ncbi:TPA: DUF2591 family protein [Klebsiella pneumoniae]|nr:DUF2591 family protein [Klebsiella pneumoniae subsp. pneumoniae]HBQ5964075.1 DUF2591 family protein [Klebsiella pneumoniae subsp. pneumoniae]HEE5202091.1 DUF2591 family protein [Klebsiella pneumoniae]
MDYSILSDFEINKLVASAIGLEVKGYPQYDGSAVWYVVKNDSGNDFFDYIDYSDFCNNPADAWPIITANKISIYAMSEKDDRGRWGAEAFYPNESYHFNDNPLRAAMIIFLMMQDSRKSPS